MRVKFPSPYPRPKGEGLKEKPRTSQARGVIGPLLCLTDFQDFNIICAAWGFHFYGIASLVIDNGFANG